MLSTVVAGLLGAASVAALAARLRALTPGGALTATLIGTVIFSAGWERAALLLLFFLSSSALSRVRRHGPSLPVTVAARTDQRDSVQVLANGGVPAFWAVVSLAFPSHPWLAPFAGAVAAAAADTWATEIGAWSPTPPVLITSRQPVRAGTSGGVTPLGLAASVAAAGVFGLLVAFITRDVGVVAGTTCGGLGGSLFDSLLGATVQEVRRCPTCRHATEQPVHALCGTPTLRVRGMAGMNNDTVNLLACAFGSLVALGVSAAGVA